MNETLDLIVVGAGPTGIAIGAEARRQGLSVLLVDRGPLTAAIQGYPTFMEFFTTRDRLEIANVPFSIPDVKPTRRQALAYYRMVVEHYDIPLALYEDVLGVAKEGDELRRPDPADAGGAHPARALASPSPPATSSTPAVWACRARICRGWPTTTRSRTRTSGRRWWSSAPATPPPRRRSTSGATASG